MSATPSENPIVPSEVIVPPIPPVLDYKAKLLELGIEESQITPELLQRFQEALRRYQSWTDANLALLEERVLWNLDKATATSQEKIIALTTWIEVQETTLPQVEPTASGLTDAAEAATAQVTETLEEMKTRLQTEATNQARVAIEAKLSNIPLFGEAIAWWLTEQGTAYLKASTEEGIWGKVKTFFIGLIAGMFWVQGIYDELKSGIETARSAELPIVPSSTESVPPAGENVAKPEDADVAEAHPRDDATIDDEAIPPIRPPVRPEHLGEATAEEIETRKKVYSKVWDVFLRQISWLILPQENSPDPVFFMLENNNLSWWEMVLIFSEYIQNKDGKSEEEITRLFDTLCSRIWIEGQYSTDRENTETILHMALWVNITNIVRQRLTSSIREDLRNDPNIKKQFWEDINTILEKEPQDMTFQEVKICLMMTLPNFFLSSWMEWIENIGEYIFWSSAISEITELGRDLQARSQNLLPPWITGYILSSAWNDTKLAQSESDTTFRGMVQQSLASGENWETWETSEDYRGMQKLIEFKNSILLSLDREEKFHLWFANFSESLRKNVNYREILWLYSLLDGNSDISQILWDDVTSSVVYVWIYNALPPSSNEWYITQWEYYWAILAQTQNETNAFMSPTEVSLVLNNTMRATDTFLRNYLSIVSNIRWTAHWAVKSEISDTLGIELSDTELTLLEYAALLCLILGNAAVAKSKLPLHIKIAVSAAMSTIGGSWFVSILYDNWAIVKIQRALNGNDALERTLNTTFEGLWFPPLSELAESSRNGVPFDSL